MRVLILFPSLQPTALCNLYFYIERLRESSPDKLIEAENEAMVNANLMETNYELFGSVMHMLLLII